MEEITLMHRLLIICGPTATGKTDLGIHLAKQFNGEIISADSRQVYKGLDIITGKDIDKNSELKIKNSELGIQNDKLSVGFREKDGIPIWLVDIVSPNYPFNVGEFGFIGQKVLVDIRSRGKLPIVVGGTGLYINAIKDPLVQMFIPPNKALRRKLMTATREQLQEQLMREDSKKSEAMNESDRNNPRRLIRAIEIAFWKKKKIPLTLTLPTFTKDSLLSIGLRSSKIMIWKRIDERIEKRIENGVIDEVNNILSKGYTSYLPAMTSTGIAKLKEYIEGRENLTEAIKSWRFQERNYAQRQMIWFKKNKDIMWFDIQDNDYMMQIEKLVSAWYTEG